MRMNMKHPIFAKLFFILVVFSPSVYAHLVEITATTPFPELVHATIKTKAVFEVTNISVQDVTNAYTQ